MGGKLNLATLQSWKRFIQSQNLGILGDGPQGVIFVSNLRLKVELTLLKSQSKISNPETENLGKSHILRIVTPPVIIMQTFPVAWKHVQ